eukprot:2678467-Rhodomonas_salina.2
MSLVRISRPPWPEHRPSITLFSECRAGAEQSPSSGSMTSVSILDLQPVVSASFILNHIMFLLPNPNLSLSVSTSKGLGILPCSSRANDNLMRSGGDHHETRVQPGDSSHTGV